MTSDKDDVEKKRLDEARRSCYSAAVDGMFETIYYSRSKWDGPNAAVYAREKEAFQRYVNPFFVGVGTAAFLFLNFRATGSRRFQQMRQEWSRKRGVGEIKNMQSHNQEAPSNGVSLRQQPHPQQEWMSHLERKQLEREAQARSSTRLLTDFLVSLSVGTSGTLFLLDAEKETFRKDFEDAPLVCGRSLVSDTTCPKMLEVVEKFPLEPKLYAENPNLESFHKFAINCQLREDYEKELRLKLGKTSDEKMEIPYPGPRGRRLDRFA
jgi:hypothetical protein